MKTLTLNNGRTIPQIGLGVYLASPEDCYDICCRALEQGFRHIDTAAVYKNESAVGRAVRASKTPRSELFITTKFILRDNDGAKLGLDAADTRGIVRRHIQECLDRLDLGYIDLLLIHAPFIGKRTDAWRVMEEFVDAGSVRSIGVSNYGVHHLDELMQICRIKPVVNQIELHPFLQNADVVQACKVHGIAVEAYSPIVKVLHAIPDALKLDDPVVVRVAKALEKTPAQVLIAWGVCKGYITLPKTVTPARLAVNMDVFFQIPDQMMRELDALECGYTTGWDPTRWE
ncbi:MAG: hypothetical protein SGCHY_002611 [Lobulomycetales sp.]